VAESPSHRFGQVIGNLLEEILDPQLEAFCRQRALYLDKKGERGGAREGKKVSWKDKYENIHDLDFVIEKGGTRDRLGRPIAFIESAWRRYTKHSRNKAQEIQGAILPVAEKHAWDKPFLGAVLAGVFTDGSLTQMRSSGFEVMLFPYETIVDAFRSVGIDAAFDETTPDREFAKAIDAIEALDGPTRNRLKRKLISDNRERVEGFFTSLRRTLDRRVDRILVLPLHGGQNEFRAIADAARFIEAYNEAQGSGAFRKYEIIVRYTNGDAIDASFQDKATALKFLKYVSS
jgi:hypothetical protein